MNPFILGKKAITRIALDVLRLFGISDCHLGVFL
jgi:hypothetical protein